MCLTWSLSYTTSLLADCQSEKVNPSNKAWRTLTLPKGKFPVTTKEKQQDWANTQLVTQRAPLSVFFMYSKTQIKKPGWNPKGGEREVQQEFVVCGQSLRCLRGSPCPKHTLSHHTVMTKRVTKQCVLCSALLTQSAPPPTPPHLAHSPSLSFPVLSTTPSRTQGSHSSG